MAEFKQVVITHKGQALMSKLMSGSGTAEFTAIKISDTSYTDEQLEGLTSLGSIKQVVPISKVTRTNEVAVQVEGAISNTDLKVGYYMRTLGLFAKDPNEGEILYAVTSASQAGYMPPYNGRTTSGAFFRLVTTIGNAKNVTLQVNPSAVATIGDIQDLQEQVNDLKGIIGYTENDIYGLEVDFENNKFTRLAGAKNRTPGASFDNLGPWNRRRCILAEEDGQVLAYYGEPGYITTGNLTQAITKNGKTYPVGTRVNVMVEQPKFYYRVVPLKIISKNNCDQILKKARYYISATPHNGFTIHPAFINSNNKIVDKIYLSAYDNSIYSYASSSTPLTSNLASVSGQLPCSKDLNGFQNLVSKLPSPSVGTYGLMNVKTYAMSQLLFVIEYAKFDAQYALGWGVSTWESELALTGTTDKELEKSTANNSLPIVYRGEENLWGNTKKIVGGLIVMYSKPAVIIKDNDEEILYKYTVQESIGTSTCLLYNKKIDWFFLPYDDRVDSYTINDWISYPDSVAANNIIAWGGLWGGLYSSGAGLFNLSLAEGANTYDEHSNSRITFYPII